MYLAVSLPCRPALRSRTFLGVAVLMLITMYVKFPVAGFVRFGNLRDLLAGTHDLRSSFVRGDCDALGAN
jgi:hypothetical protein